MDEHLTMLHNLITRVESLSRKKLSEQQKAMLKLTLEITYQDGNKNGAAQMMGIIEDVRK
jgi:hypothetical protein